MMKELYLFLKALETCLNEGQYVPHLLILPTKFGAIKTYKLDVWLLSNGYKECISSITSNENISKDKSKINDRLTVQTIVNILKYYGLQ